MTRTKKWVVCALFAAIIAIIAPFAIPVGPVPVTFTLFALALTAFVGGSSIGARAAVIYILMGIIGMPVFSGFKGGLSAFMDPTGGFIYSYIFIVLILGLCTKTKSKTAMVLLWTSALLICYAAGVSWYMFITKANFLTALTLCIVPFIPFDILKLVVAYIVAKAIRKALDKAGLM